jgi:hypothetical protein
MDLTRFALLVLGLGLAVNAIGCKSSRPRGGELTELADYHGSDKGSKWHLYSEVYELFLQPIKYEVRKVLEIGVWKGASVKMWRDYFPHAIVHGIDILDTSPLNSDTIKTHIANQANRTQLQAVVAASGGDFDIIVDDGGHTMIQQQVSFGFLFKHVRPGGYYVIEDVNTSIYALYRDTYGATPNGEDTTLAMIGEYVKTRRIESPHMTAEEKAYLSKNIAYASLVSRGQGPSIMCIFKKRGTNH